jgi:CNT family concentrative nucleoside transporter
MAWIGLIWLLEDTLGPRGRAAAGYVCFLGIAAAFSANLRAVNWRTIGFGIVLQIALAFLVLRSTWGYALFDSVGRLVGRFLEFSNAGAQFVFGKLADPGAMSKVFPDEGFVFAFVALPTIIFVASFFTLLYHIGVLQLVVRGMAWVMRFLMGTSGAETLAASANVFMGQTEAPLIIKPYVEKMTDSELLTLMVGGMATVSGGIMALFISMGADPVAILATSVMAAPGGILLAKLILPEMQTPATLGEIRQEVQSPHRNMMDAASAGASEGMTLALNIAAMLIAFLALLALVDVSVQWLSTLVGAEEPIGLREIFGTLFAPAAYLMGVERGHLASVGDLLGTKLVANEVVAYAKLTKEYRPEFTERSIRLATFALTSFANFSSIGIQLGGIGAMAPSRRADLARLGGRALFAGFLATLMNAALAGVLIP